MRHPSPSTQKFHASDVILERWRKRAGRLLVLTTCAGFMGAAFVGPAAAEDCFPKIRAAEARQALPRRAAPVRHRANAPRVGHVKAAVRIPRPKRIAVPVRPASKTEKFVESSFHQQTLPVPWVRPAGCDKHPASAIQSTPPIVEKPPGELLLAELAGPPAETETPPQDAGPTFVGGGGPGYPPVPGGGGPPPVTPPGGEPPPVTPPEDRPPPILPPDVPPSWPPVGPPPDGPPTFPPPGGPPPPPEGYPPPGPPELPPTLPPEQPPLTPVPEPATWVMLIGGFFLIGQSVRSRRARPLAE